MAIWNPSIFLTQTDTGWGDCTQWVNVSNFDNDWTDSQYWWVTRHQSYYHISWNIACAVRLLITKCNSLQAQVDALSGLKVDMDSILNSMLTASFNQLQKFIGIEDAYRVALWNAPFNVDFYAALARGFVKWP